MRDVLLSQFAAPVIEECRCCSGPSFSPHPCASATERGVTCAEGEQRGGATSRPTFGHLRCAESLLANAGLLCSCVRGQGGAPQAPSSSTKHARALLALLDHLAEIASIDAQLERAV